MSTTTLFTCRSSNVQNSTEINLKSGVGRGTKFTFIWLAKNIRLFPSDSTKQTRSLLRGSKSLSSPHWWLGRHCHSVKSDEFIQQNIYEAFPKSQELHRKSGHEDKKWRLPGTHHGAGLTPSHLPFLFPKNILSSDLLGTIPLFNAEPYLLDF